MALKDSLVKGIKENQEFAHKQAELKEKYHVEDKDVVVVEKANMIKFFVRHGIGLFHLVFHIALVLLSIIGLAALVYPDTRTALWHTAIDIRNQLVTLF